MAVEGKCDDCNSCGVVDIHYPDDMSRLARSTTLTVRVSGTLRDFVAANVGEDGAYENVSEYVRDLIRRDHERTERKAFDRLKAELTQAFAAPDSSFRPLTAAEVIDRNKT
jgi:Arc/MetJ-type ribon-helix-helix transcriptional regulator